MSKLSSEQIATANKIKTACKGISGVNTTFMLIYAYVESSLGVIPDRKGSDFVGVYQLSNDFGTEAQRKDINYSVSKAWGFFNRNKDEWYTNKKDVAIFYWEDWFGYAMHQQGVSGFRDLMLSLDKMIGKLLRDEKGKPIKKDGKYQCEEGKETEIISANPNTRVYKIEDNAGTPKWKFCDKNVCEFLNFLKFNKFEDAITILKDNGIINDKDLKDIIRNDDKLCSEKYMNTLKYSIRKEPRPLENPPKEELIMPQDKTRVAPKPEFIKNTKEDEALAMLRELGVNAKSFENIASAEDVAEISPGPNAVAQAPINKVKINVDKQVIPVG